MSDTHTNAKAARTWTLSCSYSTDHDAMKWFVTQDSEITREIFNPIRVPVIEASYAKELEAEVEYLKRSLADERSGDTDLMKTISRHERNIKSLTEKLAVAEAAILLMEKCTENLLKKGNVPWGQTFGIDFGLMNEALIAQDKALASIRGNNG